MTASAFAVAANIFLYALLGMAHVCAARDPSAPWVRALYVRQFGPRTDTRTMTPAEHFRSGLVFLVWFGAFLAALALNAPSGPGVADASNLRLAINFISSLFALLWLAGAFWVFALGLAALVRQRLSARRGDVRGPPPGHP